ncbi:MAG: S9 family peptidase [Cyanobacteria bacterium CRU_2_1]|nr:S9 family peptidase [Cyanobacteria bacterium RU_5_0]NJR58985.1 S9 family peptidase [Cyanobacteria bacterium CRU_2_1]
MISGHSLRLRQSIQFSFKRAFRSLSTLLTLAIAIEFSQVTLTRAEIVPITPGMVAPATLSSEEQFKINTFLQTKSQLILSTISPDNSTVVVAIANQVDGSDFQIKFLNLTTGEFTDFAAIGFTNSGYGIYEYLFNPMRWVDADTLRFIQNDGYGQQAIVTFNRTTGGISRTTLQLNGEILGVSPDFSQMAVVVPQAVPIAGQPNSSVERVVYLVSLPSLDRLEVTRVPPGFEIATPSWSDDSTKVALSTFPAFGQQFGRTPLSPSFANAIVQDTLGRIPPEQNPFLQQATIRIYDFTQAEPLRAEIRAADEGDLFSGVGMSPDGQRVMVRMSRPGQIAGREFPIYQYPDKTYYRFYSLDGELLDTLDREEINPPDSSFAAFIAPDQILLNSPVGIDRRLFIYHLTTQEFRRLPVPSGTVDPFSWIVSDDLSTIVYTFSSVTQPPEIFSMSLNGQIREGQAIPTQVTNVNAAIAPMNQVRVDEVLFQTANGERSGFLIQPAEAPFPPQNVPIVFWQQGGPGGAITNYFAINVEEPLNLLPNFGIAVLVVPLAGREGFGSAFYRLQADNQNFGRVDIQEGVEIVEQIIAQGWTTPSQIGIAGCSYGGYYTSQSIATFPTVFAAANPQCSLLDTLTEWQLGYPSVLSYLTGSTPMESPDQYRQDSPLYLADRIQTPTLIFHGSNDFLQVDVARNFHDVIAMNDVPVMMYEFQGAGHGLQTMEYQRIAAQLQINFFREYLQPEE